MRASLACPVCLRAPRTIALVDARDGPVAEITCAWCGRFWQIDLVLVQVARLLLDPPPGLGVRRGEQAAVIDERLRVSDEDLGG